MTLCILCRRRTTVRRDVFFCVATAIFAATTILGVGATFGWSYRKLERLKYYQELYIWNCLKKKKHAAAQTMHAR